MSFLRKAEGRVRAGLGRWWPLPVEIVKPSPKAPALAAEIGTPSRSSKPVRKAVAAINARVRSDKTPYTESYGGFRTIGEHFRAASSPPENLAMLERAVRFSGASSILEIGTAYGVGTVALALANGHSKVTTIELMEPRATIGAQNIAAVAKNVECIKGDKNDVLPRLLAEGRKFDLVFHDGGHLGDAYVADFEALVPLLEPGATIIVDNIFHDDHKRRETTKHLSRRTCREGWNEIVADPRVKGALVFAGSVGILLT